MGHVVRDDQGAPRERDASEQRRSSGTKVSSEKHQRSEHDGEREREQDSGIGIVEDGMLQARELMQGADAPSAIFCANDRTAWGAYRALERLGLRVPDDCSIVGFDNQETLAPYLDPGLTTVQLPYEQMARRAVS